MKPPKPGKFGELLKSKRLLTDAQLNIALAQQAITGELIGETAMKLGFVSSKEVAHALAEQAGLDFIDIEDFIPSEDALRLVPRETAGKIGFLPLTVENGILTIGITNPSNVLAIDTATRISRHPPRVYMIDSDSFSDALERAYYFLENPILKRIENSVKEIKDAEVLSATTVSTLSELLITDGIIRGATDVHINPTSETVHVFYRIDGVLQHGHCYPKSAHSGVASRIKILSSLDIAEQRLPQSGSFSFSLLGKKYEMRVSTIPTIYGQNIAIRILISANPLLRLSDLGFDKHSEEELRLLFSKPYGIILVTGPTGSGKTTTLYATLREINLLEKNVLTVEDPVEYRLSMLSQSEVNEKAGFDFAIASRSFMRQDPDVMLLGEIRDEETAKIAVRASITGHLIITTLHTNDATTAIPRLIDLNVDKYMLSACLLAVVAQRLVRKICINCKTEYQLTSGELKAMGLPELEGKIKKAFKGKGCSICYNTGYFRRTAIGEILVVNNEIRELIYSGASISALKDAAIRNEMRTLREDGIRKAIEGVTTFEEILRVAG